jgi:hypothetical protein
MHVTACRRDLGCGLAGLTRGTISFAQWWVLDLTSETLVALIEDHAQHATLLARGHPIVSAPQRERQPFAPTRTCTGR